ncbi:hypothetical protein ABT083_05555 [Streptomyces goshikiensis]|nr:hypothetical protein [Streptomyces goshikiensis]
MPDQIRKENDTPTNSRHVMIKWHVLPLSVDPVVFGHASFT